MKSELGLFGLLEWGESEITRGVKAELELALLFFLPLICHILGFRLFQPLLGGF